MERDGNDLVTSEGVNEESAHDDPEARMFTTTPLENDEGEEFVLQQQNVGRQNEMGGGEWPDPDTAPRPPAPGSAAVNTEEDGG